MKARAVLAALALASLSACVLSEPLKRSEYVLGTNCSLTFYDPGHKAAMVAVFARLREIEGRMSANKAGTEIDAINQSAGVEPVRVSPDSFFVIKTALEYGKKTKGALDVTIGPLVKLWGIGSKDARVPDQDEIEAAKALVDYRLVRLDEAALSVFLPKAGMRLDLGAVAKGYAADEAVRILKQAGVKRAIIDLGGNIYAMGKKRKDADWRIGIQSPDTTRGTYLGILSVADESLVTSGDYERFFEKDGKRYHHILDAKTGEPSASGLRSVTVVGKPSMACDALSTSMFVLGRKKGLELAKTMPELGFIFVDDAGKVWLSANIAGRLTIEPGQYSLAPE
jgi:thiamine biosynthesis lipoprotein